MVVCTVLRNIRFEYSAAPPSSFMNPPLTVIIMLHITIIPFHLNLLYSRNKIYLIDVGRQVSIDTPN